MITAFSNLYVSEMRRCKSEPWRVVIGDVRWASVGERVHLVIPSEVEGSRVVTAGFRHGVPRLCFASPGITAVENLFYDFTEVRHLIEPNERIHLRHLQPQFLRKTL